VRTLRAPLLPCGAGVAAPLQATMESFLAGGVVRIIESRARRVREDQEDQEDARTHPSHHQQTRRASFSLSLPKDELLRKQRDCFPTPPARVLKLLIQQSLPPPKSVPVLFAQYGPLYTQTLGDSLVAFLFFSFSPNARVILTRPRSAASLRTVQSAT
jgi:hypothetical protein